MENVSENTKLLVLCFSEKGNNGLHYNNWAQYRSVSGLIRGVLLTAEAFMVRTTQNQSYGSERELF